MKLLELTTEATASSILHPDLTHPLTGERLQGFVLQSGRVVWPPMGGAPDPDDDDTDPDDDEGEGDDPDDDTDPDDDDKSSKKKKEGEDESEQAKREKALRAEARKNRIAKREAQRERDEAKEELERLKNKDAPALETVTKERDILKTTVEAQTSTIRDQAIAIAFFGVGGFVWKDPSDALQLARKELKDVDIEDGEADAEAVAEVVKQLAEKKPWLLEDPKDSKKKPEKDPDSKGDPDEDTGSGGGSTRRTRNRKGMSAEALKKKYQALNK